ncbi:Oidioi.mRNA.OKI2018_I69.PAR.g10925.t1.cds [Oikopleura dioica]|uniref:Oidioi.mRNA.OKI2018_I69.PAR.g10925.t1.cds n=1 Tax=Oikopleura dioica TaxID=34765 RepID=A0ABN7RWN8_OIKDI|nr:Oidioi.mRNA.OKI2018_I69.PAR.g10925.t1.cds [Oikopleura dioica]
MNDNSVDPRRRIVDRIKDLNQSTAEGSFSLAPRSSSHDSIHTLLRRQESTENIIKDIPREIKCAQSDRSDVAEIEELTRELQTQAALKQTSQTSQTTQNREQNANLSLSSQLTPRSTPRSQATFSTGLRQNGYLNSSFRRSTARSQSFRSRPFSAGNKDPLRATADSIFTRQRPSNVTGSPGVLGLTKSTKLLQQYQGPSRKSTVGSGTTSGSTTSSTTSSVIMTPRGEVTDGSTGARPVTTDPETRQTKARKLPNRSQSFRTAEDNQSRQVKSTRETSIISGSTTRSQSYQTLAENQQFRSDEIQQKCSTCQPGTSAVPTRAVLRSPKSSSSQGARRAQRPTGFIHGSDPSISIGTSDEEDAGIRLNGSTFNGFRYHADELQKSTASSATSAGILSGEEPPPYHEVVRQRKEYSESKMISSSAHTPRARRHVSPDSINASKIATPSRLNLRSRPQVRPQAPAPAAGVHQITNIDSDNSSRTSNKSSARDTKLAQQSKSKESLEVKTSEIPFIDGNLVNQFDAVRIRNNSSQRHLMREQRNSYITAVNNSKPDYRNEFKFSLESIGDAVSESNTGEIAIPLGRAGSMDSVLTTTKLSTHDGIGEAPPSRAHSVDRVNTSGAHYPRKSYVEATGVPSKRIRGRPRSTGKKDEVNGLKRRPSLNKQMRKKFENVFGSKPKQQNNLDLLTRIREIPETISGEVFNIKRKSWQAAFVMIHAGYLYVWKCPEMFRNTRHMVCQTNDQFASTVDMSALLVDVFLGGCLCDVSYGTKRHHVFKISIDERNELLIEASTNAEMNEWVQKIRELAQKFQKPEDLEEMIKKKLDSDPKYKRAPNTRLSMGPRSPSQHKKRNRKTFGVPLADCPMDDDLPLVVTTCCRIIESQIETDCHGIYRTAANERIKNEVEEEMNKCMDNIHHCEALKDVKIAASVLKSFFRQLPDPLFTDSRFYAFVDAVPDDTSQNIDEESLQRIRSLLITLPQYHYNTAKYFITHLKKVADNQKFTEMDCHNLSVVITPTLLRRKTDPNDYKKPPLVNDEARTLKKQYRLMNVIIDKSNWLFSSSTTAPPPVSPTQRSPRKDPHKSDLTELFSNLPNMSASAAYSISDSGSESGSSKTKKKGPSWLNNFRRNSKENVNKEDSLSENFVSSPKKIKAIPDQVHKSRKERLEVKTRSSAQKNAKGTKSPRKNEIKSQVPASPAKEVKIKRRHTVNSPGSSSGARVPHAADEFTC